MSRTRGLYFKCDFCQKHELVPNEQGFELPVSIPYPPLYWLTVISDANATSLDFCSRGCLADYFRHDVSSIEMHPDDGARPNGMGRP